MGLVASRKRRLLWASFLQFPVDWGRFDCGRNSLEYSLNWNLPLPSRLTSQTHHPLEYWSRLCFWENPRKTTTLQAYSILDLCQQTSGTRLLKEWTERETIYRILHFASCFMMKYIWVTFFFLITKRICWILFLLVYNRIFTEWNFCLETWFWTL